MNGKKSSLRAKNDGALRCAATRVAALERLWSALKDRENTRIGYNPAVAEACEELRRIERRGIE